MKTFAFRTQKSNLGAGIFSIRIEGNHFVRFADCRILCISHSLEWASVTSTMALQLSTSVNLAYVRKSKRPSWYLSFPQRTWSKSRIKNIQTGIEKKICFILPLYQINNIGRSQLVLMTFEEKGRNALGAGCSFEHSYSNNQTNIHSIFVGIFSLRLYYLLAILKFK